MGESLGSNIRSLHDLLWTKDRTGFFRRMEEFLKIAGKHKIGVMFVLFDSVWDPHPVLGTPASPPRICTTPVSPGPRRRDSASAAFRETQRLRSGRNSKIRKRPQNPRLGSMNEPDNINGNRPCLGSPRQRR